MSVAREQIRIHDRCVSYQIGGEGPVLVLIHGLTGQCGQWDPVISPLAREFTVIAPDLPGHGRSDEPLGDYSLGAYATTVRDLMLALGHDRATVIGHSLGGGIAMQFAYQFPAHAERLVLVSSGGLGREVHPLLRAATLPGSEFVLPLLGTAPVRGASTVVGGLLERAGVRVRHDVAEMSKGCATLGNGASRQTFLNTIRSVIDYTGQRATAVDRLYLAAEMATLVIWGKRDSMIPVSHAHVAHRNMPHSRLSIFDDAGHFPQLEDPERFVQVLSDFIHTTEPSRADSAALRDQMRALPTTGKNSRKAAAARAR